MFRKKAAFKTYAEYHENTGVGVSFSWRPVTLLERDSNTRGFHVNFRIFEEYLWTTDSASWILHSSIQHYWSRCQYNKTATTRGRNIVWIWGVLSSQKIQIWTNSLLRFVIFRTIVYIKRVSSIPFPNLISFDEVCFKPIFGKSDQIKQKKVT